MKSSKRRLLVGLAFSAAMVTQALAADKIVIGYSAPGLVGAQAQIQSGLVTSAKAKGWDVLTTTSGGDAQKQLNDINDFIAQKVSAIVAVPDDSADSSRQHGPRQRRLRWRRPQRVLRDG